MAYNEQLTNAQLAPESQCRGAIVLDIPETSGVIVFSSNSLGLFNGDWEWSF